MHDSREELTEKVLKMTNQGYEVGAFVAIETRYFDVVSPYRFVQVMLKFEAEVET